MWSDVVTVNGKVILVTESIFGSVPCWYLRAAAQGALIAAAAQAGSGTCQVVDNQGHRWDSGQVAFGVNCVGIAVDPSGWIVTWMQGPEGATYAQVVLDTTLRPIGDIKEFQSPYGHTSQGFLDVFPPAAPIMTDQNRTKVCGPMTVGLPTTRGSWTAGQAWTGQPGVVAWNAADRTAWMVSTLPNQVPSHLALDGQGQPWVVVGGTATMIGRSDFVPWTPSAVRIVKIGRPLWFGPYAFGDASNVPQNCRIPVVQGAAWLNVEGPDWRYVAGHPDHGGDSNLHAINIAIQTATAPGVRVAAYVPRAAQGHLPTAADIQVIEAYKGIDETSDAFKARLAAGCRKCARVAFAAQAYSSNEKHTDDLPSVPPDVAAVAKQFPNVEAIFLFSGGPGRDTGWDDHPEIHGPWREVFAGITGAPDVEQPPAPNPTPEPVPEPPMRPTILQGDVLTPEHHGADPLSFSRYSSNGRYRLRQQGDLNFVLDDLVDNVTLWATHIAADRIECQPGTGNLIGTHAGAWAWHSGVTGPGAFYNLGDDGRLAAIVGGRVVAYADEQWKQNAAPEPAPEPTPDPGPRPTDLRGQFMIYTRNPWFGKLPKALPDRFFMAELDAVWDQMPAEAERIAAEYMALGCNHITVGSPVDLGYHGHYVDVNWLSQPDRYADFLEWWVAKGGEFSLFMVPDMPPYFDPSEKRFGREAIERDLTPFYSHPRIKALVKRAIPFWEQYAYGDEMVWVFSWMRRLFPDAELNYHNPVGHTNPCDGTEYRDIPGGYTSEAIWRKLAALGICDGLSFQTWPLSMEIPDHNGTPALPHLEMMKWDLNDMVGRFTGVQSNWGAPIISARTGLPLTVEYMEGTAHAMFWENAHRSIGPEWRAAALSVPGVRFALDGAPKAA